MRLIFYLALKNKTISFAAIDTGIIILQRSYPMYSHQQSMNFTYWIM
jgi:hypothetical protein